MNRTEIISIGNELLSGKTINTNAAWISRQLDSIGLVTNWITTIADTHAEIINALHAASQRADVIISTGGLGPTVDDITKNTICEFFNTRLVLHKETLQHVKERFKVRNIKMADVNRSQAFVPESCTVLPNDYGTAPGMMFEKNKKLFFFLPGVPKEMKGLIRESILNILKSRFNLPLIETYLLRTTGIAESSLYQLLLPVIEKHNFTSISFLPRYTGVDISLKFDPSGQQTRPEFDQFMKSIKRKASKFIFSEQDTELHQVVGELLSQQRKTLSVAESFTGGLIQDWITNISGSSAYFLGGSVTYSNGSKMKILNVSQDTLEQYGAVSKETVHEMADGIQSLYKSDCAIATTGIAGPTGATQSKPVGLCHIAAKVNDEIIIKKFTFGTDRLINKIRGATAGLEMLRRMLINK